MIIHYGCLCDIQSNLGRARDIFSVLSASSVVLKYKDITGTKNNMDGCLWFPLSSLEFHCGVMEGEAYNMIS